MTELTPRLEAAASLLGIGNTVIDVGSDHGYLPLYLLKNDRFSYAVVTDIAKNPLDSAKRNFAAEGEERAEFILCDGLRGVSVPDNEFSVSVCGMGGEMIASILDTGRPFFGAEKFVLQPMTKSEKLRSFLWNNGFEITSEVRRVEGAKVYEIMCAVYTGRSSAFSAAEALIGKREALCADGAAVSFLDKTLSVLKRNRDGKASAGVSCDADDALMKDVEKELLYFKELII